MVFYEYFLKSSVGDAEWKTSCLEPSGGASSPLTNYQTEAFALLVLRNNYFAWLLDIKKKAGRTLVTDYDDPALIRTRKDLGQEMIKVEINAHDIVADEDECDSDSDSSNTRSSPAGRREKLALLIPETSPRYTSLRMRTEAHLALVRSRARDNPKYKELLKALEEYEKEREVEDENTEMNVSEQRTKRRKLLRQFRLYTNGKDEQERFKGWSKRAKGDLKDLTAKVKRLKDSNTMQRFRQAYRLTFSDKVQSAKKLKQPEDLGPPIDHNIDIWGSDSEEEPEIYQA